MSSRKSYPVLIRFFIAYTFTLSSNLFGGDFWMHTGGPIGGSIINIFSSQSNRIYAADETNNGLYLSTDGGLFWSRFATFNEGIRSTLVLKNGTLLISSSSTIYSSSDSGKNWNSFSFGPGNSDIRGFAEGSDSVILAISNKGMFRSTDNGGSWSPGTGVMEKKSFINISTDSAGRVFAATDSIVIVSNNAGETWDSIGHPHPAYGIQFNTFLAYGDGYVFCGLPYNGFYRYTPQDKKWTKVSSVSSFIGCTALTTSDRMYLGTEGGVYRSDNLGETWNFAGLKSIPVLSIFVRPDNTLLAGIPSVGIVVSFDDCQNWYRTVIPSTNVYSVLESGSQLVASEYLQGILVSTNHGASWDYSDFNKIGRIFIGKKSNGMLFALGGYQSLYRSTDNGLHWNDLGFTDEGFLQAVAFDKNGVIYVGADNANYSLYRSVDNGLGWVQTGFYHQYNSNINAIAVLHDNTILVGTQMWGVMRSVNGTNQWAQSGLDYTSVNELLAASSGTVIAGGQYGGIHRSTDDGKSWENVLPEKTVESFAADSSGHIFAGFYGGVVMQSVDDGVTWKNSGSGLSCSHIYVLYSSEEGFLYAGTDNGLYRSVSRTTDVRQYHVEVPRQFSLLQNYPNPFNTSTVIGYSISKPGVVTLTLFDQLGRAIGELVNGYRQPGDYRENFDADRLASGLYFYRLQSGGQVETRVMLLLK